MQQFGDAVSFTFFAPDGSFNELVLLFFTQLFHFNAVFQFFPLVNCKY